MSRRLKWASVIVVVLGFGFLGGAVWATWDTFVDALTFDAGTFAGAALLCLAGLAALAFSWAAVHPPSADRRAVARRFLLAQPAKYVPGGVTMPAGQVILSRPYDTSIGSAVSRLVIHSGLMVLGAVTVASPMLVVGPRKWIGGLGSVVVVVSLAALLFADLDRIATGMVRLARRVTRRPGSEPVALDVRRADMFRAYALVVLAMSCLAAAFPVVGGQLGESPIRLAAAFALAWAIGFVLVPLPAGAGAREATLVFVLAGTATVGRVIAVSVVYRAAMLVAEVVWAAVAVVGERGHESNMRSLDD